jgi:hypothetical protein
MPQPTAGDVHVNAPLTSISIAFLQDQASFVARKVFPVVPVQHRSDRYYVYDKKQWFRSDARKRAPGTESAGSGFTVDNTPNYFADVRAIHKDVDDQVRANADAVINPDRDATEFVTRDLMLEQELDWASTYFTTGVWTGSTTGGDIVPGTLWDVGGSTPIEDLRAQMTSILRRTGFMPNKVVLGIDVWNVLQDHADFLERIKFVERAIVAPELLASLLELDEVLISKAVQDLDQEGPTDDMQFIMDKDVLLVYAAPRASLLHPSGGYTFAWTGMFGANAAGMRVKRFRMEELSADRVEGESAYDHKLVAPECGAFFNGVIS